MEQIRIRNLLPGTKVGLRARAQPHRQSVEAEGRGLLARGLAAEPVTSVDLLGGDEGADITFDPEPLRLTARSADL